MEDYTSESPIPQTEEGFFTAIADLGDAEVMARCLELVLRGELEDQTLARAIVETGLARGELQAREVESRIASVLQSEGQVDWRLQEEKRLTNALEEIVGLDENLKTSLETYGQLYQARQRLDTFDIMSSISTVDTAPTTQPIDGAKDAKEGQETDEDIEVDDPWAEDGEAQGEVNEVPLVDDPWESSSNKSAAKSEQSRHSTRSTANSPPLLPLSIPLGEFLSQPTQISALELASSAALSALRTVFDRHYFELFPIRFAVLEGLPGWVMPGDLKDHGLLPIVGEDSSEIDRRDSRKAPPKVGLFERFPVPNPSLSATVPRLPLKSSEELSKWFVSRVEALDSLGALDLQLAWVQHGASLGVQNLDALGEDLSLLSRLIYDADLSQTQHEKWTLAAWKAATEGEIVAAYLANSKPTTIVGDIRRLVMPYLYVLESRAEREGHPDNHLVERLLHEAVLSLSLQKALPVFEASKATLPMSDRLLRNDQNVARLALACLYGSDEREVWSTMSGIFECLPVWDVSGGDLESDREATAMTLDSIATFVRPTTSSARPPTAQDLFIFFAPLPFAALSRALDILDVHLESGEILARWDTAVQLRFLLQSARDKDEQIQIAEKLVRRQAGNRNSDKWPKLWEDMCRLSGGEDALLRGAFGMLSVEDMMTVYLRGIFSSGNFDVARKMIRRFETEYHLSAIALQGAALATSRELYDNAETGNIHTGDMKLAYDCLSIPPSSAEIQRERAFIEATSRLTSFSSLSLTPFQIRHAKSKLNLIRRVISTSDDAYRHEAIILELAGKLGLGDTPSRGQIFGMLADAAVSHAEFDLAYDYTQRLFELVKDRHKRRSTEEDEELRAVLWKTCLELGRQDEWSDIDSRMLLLGRAVEYCPSDTIPSILTTWRKVEDGSLKLSQAAKRRRLAGIKEPTKSYGTLSATASPIVGNSEDRVLGSRTAARAAKMALGFGERFKGQIPFSATVSPHLPSLSSSREASRDRSGGEERRSLDSDRGSLSGLGFGTGNQTDAERVGRHARKALVRGVGWLLGADEREIE